MESFPLPNFSPKKVPKEFTYISGWGLHLGNTQLAGARAVILVYGHTPLRLKRRQKFDGHLRRALAADFNDEEARLMLEIGILLGVICIALSIIVVAVRRIRKDEI
jgi:hypothetical protein